MFIILRIRLCLCWCSKTMKMKKAHTCFLILVILTFLLSPLFVQCSTSTGIYKTSIAGSRRIATSIEVAKFRNEGPFVGVGKIEDSARLVPTGPDPLHHNNNPLEP